MNIAEKPQALVAQTTRRPLRVLIVSRTLLGFSERSEPATFFSGLAEAITAQGDSVKFLMVPPLGAALGTYYERARKVIRELKELHLVDADVLVAAKDTWRSMISHELISYAVLDFVRANAFDVVYYAVEDGIGFFTATARRTGLLPSGARLVAVANQPRDWLRVTNRTFFSGPDDLVAAFMERESAKLADEVLCVGEPMRRWLVDNGWSETSRITVLPHLLPAEFASPTSRLPVARIQPAREFVLVANTDHPDGTTMFCDAMDRLAASGEVPRTVTLAGAFASVLGEHTGGMLLRRARRWPVELLMLPNQTPAATLDYLKRGDRLAVFSSSAAQAPALFSACLDTGIPFVAVDGGWGADLIDRRDLAAHLVAPKAADLAARLKRAIAEPTAPARVSGVSRKRADALGGHLQRIADQPADQAAPARRRKGPSKSSDAPLVTIVMAHHDRPQLVVQAIQSVARQDHPNIELIIVDDGSILPESHRLLDSLEPDFKIRGWRIFREPNRYLGAARNVAIKVAKGDLVLFLDDDNVLFDNAVSTLVKAIERSGADICTCLSRSLFETSMPRDDRLGTIEYLPTGGPLEISMIRNPYGDANAMFRKSVFERIGYLVEDYGFACQDWEIFTRAALEGLHVQVVPEPLYWYRSNPEGMYRSSHYYDNRQPIISLFRRYGFPNLERTHQLAISGGLADGDRKSLYYNLHWDPANARMMALAELAPNSDEAIRLLAEIAAGEGRSETTFGLLGNKALTVETDRVLGWAENSNLPQQLLGQSAASLLRSVRLDPERLSGLLVVAEGSAGGRSVAHVEGTQLILDVRMTGTTTAALANAFPKGTVRLFATIEIDPELPNPVEARLVASSFEPELDAVAPGPGGEWRRISQPHERLELQALLPEASDGPVSLVLQARTAGGAGQATTQIAVSDIGADFLVGPDQVRRPRRQPGEDRQRAKSLGPAEVATARLLTNYPADTTEMVLLPGDQGLLLRANRWGMNLALLPHAFSAFARRMVAQVELRDIDAPPLEIAMALSKPEEYIEWRTGEPDGAVGFSGWMTIRDPFELRTLSARVAATTRMQLNVQLAIRPLVAPTPGPVGVTFRKFVLSWTD